MQKKILMIGTGGTIASKQTTYGLSPGLTSQDILSYIPQVSSICEVDTLQICNIDSTNMRPKYWNLIVDAIESHYKTYDGFVICHGTDTLAYSASALSYMIQNSRKPIVFTGAQRPINMDVTDAKTNLLDSFIYASCEDSQGVSIVFDGKVIAGTRAKKERAKSYNAFSSINFPYLAVIQDGTIIRYILEPPYTEPLTFYHEMQENIYLLKLYPGISSRILSILFETYDCIVLESFGVGGIPEHFMSEFYQQMQSYSSLDKLIVMTTQVVSEGSNMTVYEVGRKIKHDFDMLESYDMTLESTLAKLMWILTQPTKNFQDIKSLFYKRINHDILFH